MSLKKLIGSCAPLLAVVAWVTLPPQRLAAQYASGSSGRQAVSAWENDRIRVRTVSVAPGARLAAAPGGADRVIVFLTGDLDGHMPAAEAIWQPGGGPESENHGAVRVDAIVVDVKPGTGSAASETPVEAVSSDDGANARLLIDNARVTVMKLRYRPYPVTLPAPHAHSQDALVVYLSGGFTWPPYIGWGYPARVHRGEFDVIPAHLHHSFGNAGGDNLDFLMILAK
jgi:quercetin dioxygenase-like cupin family protein